MHPPLQMLRRQTVRYDDQRGPVVLTVLLVAVTLMALVLALTSINALQPPPPTLQLPPVEGLASNSALSSTVPP
jgi:hypothetical protein